MGKPTGFLEYDRQDKSAVSPLERINNFEEFKISMSPEERRVQAARCMDCGIPFCQSCIQLKGMWSGCPLHNLIPEYNDLLYHGNWKMALSRLLKTNNFPEFTGRVCPALCEAACTCGLNGDPVTAHDNEAEIIETGFKNGWVLPRIPKVRTNKHIAVIGSGPAGLAAGDCLNRRGHNVTVYERENRPGGLLMYGIPNMKLDKKIIERRIDLMKKEGVIFKTNVDVGGASKSAKDLLSEYDAVILACGSKAARDLNVPGRDASGVYFAVDFLTAATKKVTGQTQEFAVSAKDKNVVIIGGGDTGNDCVGTCIRQGAASVTQLEMMPKSPDVRAKDNPWPEWPVVCKVDYGQQEAIAVFGHDPRIYQITVKEIIKDEAGAVKELVTVRLESRVDEASGRRYMGEIEGSEETVPCELLLIAAGFTGCESYVAEAFGLERGPRGTLNTLPDSYMVDLAGEGVSGKSSDGYGSSGRTGKIFAAGDCRRGQSLVVWGIAEGRACAREVDEFLMGYSNM